MRRIPQMTTTSKPPRPHQYQPRGQKRERRPFRRLISHRRRISSRISCGIPSRASNGAPTPRSAAIPGPVAPPGIPSGFGTTPVVDRIIQVPIFPIRGRLVGPQTENRVAAAGPHLRRHRGRHGKSAKAHEREQVFYEHSHNPFEKMCRGQGPATTFGRRPRVQRHKLDATFSLEQERFCDKMLCPRKKTAAFSQGVWQPGATLVV